MRTSILPSCRPIRSVMTSRDAHYLVGLHRHVHLGPRLQVKAHIDRIAACGHLRRHRDDVGQLVDMPRKPSRHRFGGDCGAAAGLGVYSAPSPAPYGAIPSPGGRRISRGPAPRARTLTRACRACGTTCPALVMKVLRPFTARSRVWTASAGKIASASAASSTSASRITTMRLKAFILSLRQNFTSPIITQRRRKRGARDSEDRDAEQERGCRTDQDSPTPGSRTIGERERVIAG